MTTMNDRPYVDRNGRLHTAAVLTAWSPKMLEIMKVRKLTLAEIKKLERIEVAAE